MQITFTYRDTVGDFTVDAEVNGNRVQIVAITDDYQQDIDFDDFSEGELKTMRELAVREYHNIINSDDDESVFDNEDEEEAYAE